MGVFLLLLLAGLWVLLTLIVAMRPNPSQVSHFELKRRAKTSERSRKLLHRETRLDTIIVVLRFKSMFVLILLMLVATLLAGLGWGVVVTFVAAFAALWVSTFQWVFRAANTMYAHLEPKLIAVLDRTDSFWRHIHGIPAQQGETFHQIDSKEHLIYLLEQASEVLDLAQRRRLVKGLSFDARKVSGVMVPKKSIKTVSKDEFLGPLVLDELHASGHRQLPVTGKDINHIVGILSLERLLSLDVRRSLTAEKAMQKNVQYIHQNDTLSQALDLFMQSGQWVIIVVNDKQETVGLVGLRDIIDALTGYSDASDANDL